MKSAVAFREQLESIKKNKILRFEENYKKVFDEITRKLEKAVNECKKDIYYKVVFNNDDWKLFYEVLAKYGYTIIIHDTTEFAKTLKTYSITISIYI